MVTPPPGAVTDLVLKLAEGDQRTVDQLLPLVYGELHRLAQRYMRGERPDHTLTTTALVHEAYLRLVDQTRVAWRDRRPARYRASCATRWPALPMHPRYRSRFA